MPSRLADDPVSVDLNAELTLGPLRQEQGAHVDLLIG
jgi:hypothetical protein